MIVEPNCFLLSCFFMDNLVKGDKFKLEGKNYEVKCLGKFKTEIKGIQKEFKTLTLKSEKESVKFYFFYGIGGNPKSKSRKSDSKQNNFMRNVEGEIIVDLLNVNNKFHQVSDVYKIANRTS